MHSEITLVVWYVFNIGFCLLPCFLCLPDADADADADTHVLWYRTSVEPRYSSVTKRSRSADTLSASSTRVPRTRLSKRASRPCSTRFIARSPRAREVNPKRPTLLVSRGSPRSIGTLCLQVLRKDQSKIGDHCRQAAAGVMNVDSSPNIPNTKKPCRDIRILRSDLTLPTRYWETIPPLFFTQYV